MKKQPVLIPWHHVDALSHGDWSFTLDSFISWIRSVQKKASVLKLLKSRNYHESYALALARTTIEEQARKYGLAVRMSKK